MGVMDTAIQRKNQPDVIEHDGAVYVRVPAGVDMSNTSIMLIPNELADRIEMMLYSGYMGASD